MRTLFSEASQLLSSVTLLASLALVLGTPALAEAQSEAVTVSAVGDIMMGTDYPENKLPPDSGLGLFDQAQAYISKADIRFGNLEGTLYDGGLGPGSKKGGANRYLFRTPTKFAPRLSEAGFNVLSLANNHSRDFGPAGLQSTKDALKNEGIQFSSKEGEIAKFNIRGTQVALIALDYYPGKRSITQPSETLKEISQLSGKFEILIVSIHAGGEGKGAEFVPQGDEIFLGENRGNSVSFARAAIDSGADLVIMHGPHVPRGLEVYRKRLIAYSLGNFLTGRGISVAGNAGLAPLIRVQLKKNGEFLRGHLASFYQSRSLLGVIYDQEKRALKLMRQLSERDFAQSRPEFDEEGFFYPSGKLIESRLIP